MTSDLTITVPTVPKALWEEFFAEPMEDISGGDAGLVHVQDWLLWTSLLISIGGESIYRGTHPPALSLIGVALGPAWLIDNVEKQGKGDWQMGQYGPILRAEKLDGVARLTVWKEGVGHTEEVFNIVECDWSALVCGLRRVAADASVELRTRLRGEYAPLVESWLARSPWNLPPP